MMTMCPFGIGKRRNKEVWRNRAWTEKTSGNDRGWINLKTPADSTYVGSTLYKHEKVSFFHAVGRSDGHGHHHICRGQKIDFSFHARTFLRNYKWSCHYAVRLQRTSENGRKRKTEVNFFSVPFDSCDLPLVASCLHKTIGRRSEIFLAIEASLRKI